MEEDNLNYETTEHELILRRDALMSIINRELVAVSNENSKVTSNEFDIPMKGLTSFIQNRINCPDGNLITQTTNEVDIRTIIKEVVPLSDKVLENVINNKNDSKMISSSKSETLMKQLTCYLDENISSYEESFSNFKSTSNLELLKSSDCNSLVLTTGERRTSNSSKKCFKDSSRTTISIDHFEILKVQINSNHIICTDWIDGVCNTTTCRFQHPKLKLNSIYDPNDDNFNNTKSLVKNVDNYEIITELHCLACNIVRLQLSTDHIIQDPYCKMCYYVMAKISPCSNSFLFHKTQFIIERECKHLINIWHHMLQRNIMSHNNQLGLNENNTSFSNCLMKLTNILSTKLDLLNRNNNNYLLFCKHVILGLQITKSDTLLQAFLKNHQYNSKLIIFTTKLSIDCTIIVDIISCTINNQLETNNEEDLPILLKKFCEISQLLDNNTVLILASWLRKTRTLSIRYHILYYTLKLILGSRFESMNFVIYNGFTKCNKKFWIANFALINEIYSLIFDNRNCLYNADLEYILIHSMILAHFFNDSEEFALQLSIEWMRYNFIFVVIHCRICLLNNSPVHKLLTNLDDKVLSVEYQFTKSLLVLKKESPLLCINLLKDVPNLITNSNCSYEIILDLKRCENMDSNSHVIELYDSILVNLKQTSSLWMCLILYYILTHKSQLIIDVCFKSNTFLSQSPLHLCRCCCFIIQQLGQLNDDAYFLNLKSIFQHLDLLIDYKQYAELIRSINFNAFTTDLYEILLYFIDYCGVKFRKENVELLIVQISEILINHHYDKSQVNNVLCRLVLCYSVDENVWLGLLNLQRNLNIDNNEILDLCNHAICKMPNSKKLWVWYANCVTLCKETEFIKNG